MTKILPTNLFGHGLVGPMAIEAYFRSIQTTTKKSLQKSRSMSRENHTALKKWIETFDDASHVLREIGVRPVLTIAWTFTDEIVTVTHATLQDISRNQDGQDPDDIHQTQKILAKMEITGSGFIVLRGSLDAPSAREILHLRAIRASIEEQYHIAASKKSKDNVT